MGAYFGPPPPALADAMHANLEAVHDAARNINKAHAAAEERKLLAMMAATLCASGRLTPNASVTVAREILAGVDTP